jgi:integrase
MTKNNGKVYDVIFRIITIDGVEKQKWLRGYKSKALAKQGYLQFVQECCEFVRHNPKKKKEPEKEKLLVGDLYRQYTTTLGNVNKASVIYDKNNIFRNYILPKYNETSIDKLTKEELYIWQDELWATKNAKTGTYFSHKYLTKIRGQFSTFLSWCAQRYGTKNNLLDVAKPKNRQQKKEMQFWTRAQFEQFIAVVDNPTYHALFTFMFFTGRRKGELFALFKTDVKADKITIDKSVNRRKFGNETWEITSTKANKATTIPVCKPVQDEIKNYEPPKNGKFYFGGEEPLPPTTVERVFKKYVVQAGVPMIRIHDLRHSFVSMLIHLGASVFTIAELISDEVEQIHKTYGHLYQEDKLNIISKIK